MKKQIQCSQPHVPIPSLGLPPATEHLVPRDGERHYNPPGKKKKKEIEKLLLQTCQALLV